MFDPQDELVRFLDEHGVYGWVKDAYGRCLRVDDWADHFLTQAAEALTENGNEAAGQLKDLRDFLDEKPRKSVSVKKLREILQIG